MRTSDVLDPLYRIKENMEGKFEELTREGFLKNVFDYEHNSEWEYKGTRPCLIAFHDDKCPPCQALATVLKDVALVYSDQVKFFQVDFENEEQLASELGVKNLPTLVLCPLDDRPVVLQGVATEEKLMEAVKRELLSNEKSSLKDRSDD